MAFHFNWSPLIADTDRVRHMLTASLNKTPKPPIIVSDIIVNELNLGSTPPSLEILEVGDLAEDRFRGVFRVKYEGDAYLTLRTKVQANPLRTFLSGRSDWVDPGVGAAGGGLTIPLQITLSDIRLSGFAILVFSKQKGITLVFRNDPLEGLKVGSTFDSIPFVREYLQRTIEGQLRVLFMEDLPAIIHRLSLRVFNAEHQVSEREAKENEEVEKRLDSSFEREARQNNGDEEGGNIFGFEPQGDTYADFSQKNLLRLAALSESQRTLSLFTPAMRDTVYRAWATSADRQNELLSAATPSLHRPTLSRIQSAVNVGTGPGTLSSAASYTSEGAASSHATRPTFASTGTSTYTLGQSSQARPRPRKRKNRVVNLRKNRGEGGASTDGGSDAVSVSSGYETASRSESAGVSANVSSDGLVMGEGSTVPTSSSSLRPRTGSGEREGEVFTPNGSPKKKVGWREREGSRKYEESQALPKTSRRRPVTPRNPEAKFEDPDETPRQSMYLPPQQHRPSSQQPPELERSQQPRRQKLPRMQTLPAYAPDTQAPSSKQHGKHPSITRSSSELSVSDMVSGFPQQSQSSGEGSNGGILEQAWMMKMAQEIASRVAMEKGKAAEAWHGPDEEDEAPPPAYVS